MKVSEALHAIAGTGEGHCWYCDVKLPQADEAVRLGWDVRRLNGERVGGLVLVCPACLRQKRELGDEGFLRAFARRVLGRPLGAWPGA